jgi:HD-GYP domain-containing protein (c-di-GMP phosphodiesterase class II)
MRKPLPLRVRLFIWLVAAAAVGLLAWWLQAWQVRLAVDATSFELIAILGVLGVVAGHFRLRIMPRQDVDMVNAVHFASLLLFGAPSAMIVVGATTLLTELTVSVRRHFQEGVRLRSVHQVVFQTSQWVLSAGVGGLVYYQLVPQAMPARLDRLENAWAVPAAAAAMYLVNSGLVAAVAGLQRSLSPVDLWLISRRRRTLEEAALYLLGLIAARTAVQDPWSPLLMVLPVAIVYVSLKRSVQLQSETIEAVEALADIVDRRDRYTFEHSRRVARYAAEIARTMGVSADEVETIRLAARVHDLGKIGVPDRVLFKPGALTPAEKALMDQHPEMGYEILSRFPAYRQRGGEMVRSHHEHFDGGGYPNHLAGSRLSLGAQIIALADALDAMTSDRPYRRALTFSHALAEVRRGKGVQWAPEVVDALERLLTSPGAVAFELTPRVAVA